MQPRWTAPACAGRSQSMGLWMDGRDVGIDREFTVVRNIVVCASNSARMWRAARALIPLASRAHLRRVASVACACTCDGVTTVGGASRLNRHTKLSDFRPDRTGCHLSACCACLCHPHRPVDPRPLSSCPSRGTFVARWWSRRTSASPSHSRQPASSYRRSPTSAAASRPRQPIDTTSCGQSAHD
jgi:hypothetical protein